jgi:hypothetical protein
MREEIENALERFAEQKWMYALNMATVEPFGWEMTGANKNKPARKKQQGPKENREVLYLTQGDCAWVY